MNEQLREPFELGEMPLGRPMETVDEQLVRAPWRVIFDIARKVDEWPAHLSHYRYVRYRAKATDQLTGTFGDGEFFLTGASGTGFPSLMAGSLDRVWEFVQNETATAIV